MISVILDDLHLMFNRSSRSQQPAADSQQPAGSNDIRGIQTIPWGVGGGLSYDPLYTYIYIERERSSFLMGGIHIYIYILLGENCN